MCISLNFIFIKSSVLPPLPYSNPTVVFVSTCVSVILKSPIYVCCILSNITVILFIVSLASVITISSVTGCNV